MDMTFFRIIEGKKFTDKDKNIVAWQRNTYKDLNDPLAYIYPQPGDNIKDKKFFAVKDYEKALFYNKGQLIGVISGGVYELDKKARVKGTEIVWIDTSLIKIPWGIPQSTGIPTKDGHVIGLHGDLKLKINNIKIFYSEIVAGKNSWTKNDLKSWIMSLIQSSLRDIFKNYVAKSIILEDKERVVNLVISKITEDFMRFGLELEAFNIMGIKVLEGTAKLFESDKLKTEIADGASVGKLEELVKQKESIQARIKELTDKMNEQQDLLLEDKISREDYEIKKNQIQAFINDAQKKLKSIDLKIFNK